jgi:ubinuclein
MLAPIIDDPLGGGGEDDDVARIAREMEAKYGSGSSYGKSSVKDVDRGVGYDNNDSFIDDTDAYDEFIPDEYIPDRGGFYVNSGLLEFKKIPNFERPGDEIRMPKARKRALSTSSESEAEDQNKKPASCDVPIVKKNVNKEKKAKSSITASSSSDEQGKAAKKAKKTSAEALPSIKEQDVIKEKKNLSSADGDNKKEEKTTTVKDMLRAKRDFMRKIEQDKMEGVPVITIDADDGSESNSLADSNDSHNESNVAPTTSKSNGQTTELSLPSTFSPELCQSIINLKVYVLKTASVNTNFYDNHVKEQLIKIDDLGKLHNDTSIQLQVYKQLETFIPSSKKAILSKVNRFRIQNAESKLKSQIKKLKSAINKVMPNLVKKFDEDLRDYEGKKNLGHINPFDEKAPRRKFRWDDTVRKNLTDTIQLITELHKVSKSKKDSIEEFKNNCLKNMVLPLWPEEWIKFDDLKKELERKERGATQQNVPQSNLSSQNGKFTPPPQKTENPAVHDKSPSPSLTQKQQQISVIKKSSDHSISSIMSSPSSPPPSSIHSQPVNVAQLKAKITQLSEPKTPEKRHRMSDGSDSDCAIIESPKSVASAAATLPNKTPDTHHHYVSNNKQQQNEVKKAKEAEEDYSNLINSFSLLTVSILTHEFSIEILNFPSNFKGKKASSSPNNISNIDVSTSSQDRNLNTSHGK